MSNFKAEYNFESENVERLDIFLAEVSGKSRGIIQSCIKNSNVRVNNKVCKKVSKLLKTDDVVTLDFIDEASDAKFLDEDFVVPDIEIVYEDDFILVINKPVGIVTHIDDYYKENTLVQLIMEKGISLSKTGAPERPGVVHRLDKDTEGLILLAKTDEALAAFAEMFKNRAVDKYYYAMVRGDMPKSEYVIDRPIARHSKERIKMAVSTNLNAKEAKTIVKVLKRFNTKTLVEAKLITGRTHQIRVHLAAIGHPVLGDPLYGKKLFGKAQLLQSYKLQFEHPFLKKFMSFELPISTRLQAKKQ